MYYPDLTPYEYCYDENSSKQTLLNIGWLDELHSYPKGNVDENILKKIGLICKRKVQATRGPHQCQFCNNSSFGMSVEIEGELVPLGCAEIRVKGGNNVTYAAPDLIYHYIKDHNYLPPKEFLDAVEQTIIDPPSFMSRLKKRILNLLRIQN